MKRPANCTQRYRLATALDKEVADTCIRFDAGCTMALENTFRITYFDPNWFRVAELIQCRLKTVER
jgi:hypothetical protein